MLLAIFAVAAAASTPTFSPDPERQLLRAVYKELVNSNTSYSTGQTTPAAEAMARRLVDAGFPKDDVVVLGAAPHKGNVVARYRGTGKARPLLLLAHLDVGRGEARGLERRSVHAAREGRLLLRPRQRRRQDAGRDLGGEPRPNEARGLPSLARPDPGADRGRGRRRAVQRQVTVTVTGAHGSSPMSPVRDDVLKATERLTTAFWPGVVTLPYMVMGGTDGRMLRAGGIPTYGVQGLFFDATDIRFHGRDERVGVACSTSRRSSCTGS